MPKLNEYTAREWGDFIFGLCFLVGGVVAICSFMVLVILSGLPVAVKLTLLGMIVCFCGFIGIQIMSQR